MKNLFTTFTLALAMSTSLTAQAFELKHDGGVIQQEKTPQRIVTYDLAVLDSLHELGVAVAAVPGSKYEGVLEPYNKMPVAGTLFEPDYDALTLLQPDLIFAGGRSARAIPDLEKLAPVATYGSDTNNFMASFTANNLALARAFGKEEQATQLLEQTGNNVARLQELNQGKTGVFLFTINGMVMAHAPGDRFGYSYDLTGLTPVLKPKAADAAPMARPEPGSPEAKAMQQARAQQIAEVAASNPDWLLVLDRGAINGGEKTAEKTLAEHPQLSQTEAYKQGRVVYLDPNGWYIIGGGLNNLKQISEDLLEQM